MALEHEFKWAAGVPDDNERFLHILGECEALGVLKIYDTYFDNDEKYYSLKKMSCRIRNQNGQYTLTFKSDSKISGGLAVREEKNFPLIAKNLADALKESQQYLPSPKIKKIFSIENERTNYLLKKDFNAEVSFDNCMIKAGNKTAHLREIEMELLCGDEKSFHDFAKYLTKESGLKHQVVSKVETALSLLRS